MVPESFERFIFIKVLITYRALNIHILGKKEFALLLEWAYCELDGRSGALFALGWRSCNLSNISPDRFDFSVVKVE